MLKKLKKLRLRFVAGSSVSYRSWKTNISKFQFDPHPHPHPHPHPRENERDLMWLSKYCSLFINRNYNKIHDFDWFCARLFVA